MRTHREKWASPFAPNRELWVIPLLSSRWHDLGCHWINWYKFPPTHLTTGWMANFWTISTMVALIRFNCYNWPHGQIDLRRVCRLRTLINLTSQPSQTKNKNLLSLITRQPKWFFCVCSTNFVYCCVSLGHRAHTFLGLFLQFRVISLPFGGSYKDTAFVLKGTRQYDGNNL